MSDGDTFGVSVANVGDLDGGGGTVIVVGATGDDTGGSGRGALHLLSYNASGALTATTKIDDSTTLNVAGAPDALALSDGNEALALPSPMSAIWMAAAARSSLSVLWKDDTGGTDRGALYLLSFNAGGALTATTKIDDSTTMTQRLRCVGRCCFEQWRSTLASSVASVGDLYGSGETVIAVGAWGDDTGGTNRGAVYLLRYQ